MFAPFDLGEYKQKERSLYFEYEDVTLSPYAMNWSEVIESIIQFKVQGMSENYQLDYQALKSKFHQDNEDCTLPFSTKLYKYLDKL